jgi:hypothetical protein
MRAEIFMGYADEEQICSDAMDKRHAVWAGGLILSKIEECDTTTAIIAYFR